MSIAVVNCRAQLGLNAPLVHVEVSLDSGLPVFAIVGLPATVVRESKDRVRAALGNSDFEFPSGRIIVNLSPADIPKHGGRFDLPIALGILLASAQIRSRPLSGSSHLPGEFYGELGLGGELKPVPGMLLAASHAMRDGHEILVPQSNSEEVRLLLTATASSGSRMRPSVRAAEHLLSVCAHVSGMTPLPLLTPLSPNLPRIPSDSTLDLNDIRGQSVAKRALAVAAAGSHSVLMRGPPGAGKTMLAMRLPTLLPPMTDLESLEVAAIASVSGLGFNPSTFGRRPVRIPHHTTSAVALIGGGPRARPGEISLAHHGVLFLDELLEYNRHAIEALREPLESGVVSISRAAVHADYPAEFQLIAAMNPCACGHYGDPDGQCLCKPADIIRYQARVSGPMMERFDMHLEVPRVSLADFDDTVTPKETSAATAARVTRARDLQLRRQGKCNGRLPDSQVDRVCALSSEARALLDRAMTRYGLSARSRQRTMKLARTIADLAGDEAVNAEHVSEALVYRRFDRPSELSSSTPADPNARR
jgi:magnesium chelatase family protein